MALLAMTPFYLVGAWTDPARAVRLDTALDRAIPFLPWTVWIYSLVYTSVFLPAFVVRDWRLFRRTLLAFAGVMACSILIYAIFPVTAAGFRPDPDTLSRTTFLGWGTWLTFTVDPPVNLFPSMHLAAAVISALAAHRARPAFGALAAVYVIAIAITICTMKQHYIADGVAAVLLAAGVWALAIRGYDAEALPLDERAASWAGVAAYVGFQFLFYAAFYTVWRIGFAPR